MKLKHELIVRPGNAPNLFSDHAGGLQLSPKFLVSWGVGHPFHPFDAFGFSIPFPLQ